MPQYKAVIAGAHGVTGRALAGHLAKLPEWDVIGLSRRSDPHPDGIPLLSVDLLDRADCAAKLGGVKGVTHIFFAALQAFPTPAEHVAPNLAMLANLVETIEAAGPGLQRVVLVQGTKYYGVHLGPFKTPAKETDPRHMPPNFYYDQEDYLRARQGRAGWTWSAVRPCTICGFSVGSPMNLTTVIAVYAAISRELGLPLRFPGTVGAFNALRDVTDAELLAKSMVWAALEPRCAGEAFNVTNGEAIRWSNLWPRFARLFGMEMLPPQKIVLSEMMADKGPLWDAMVRKYGLQPHGYEQVVSWGFGDLSFSYDYDLLLDTGKARRYGFAEHLDSEAMFERIFREFMRQKMIPGA